MPNIAGKSKSLAAVHEMMSDLHRIGLGISRRVLLVNECILRPRRLACERQASERFLTTR